MVSLLDARSSGLGVSTGREHCCVFELQTLSLVFNSDASTSANTLILISVLTQALAPGSNFFLYLVLALMLATVCAATSENEKPLRHNTSTRMRTTRGYVWPMKTLDPDYLAPKQFSKIAESSDECRFPTQ